METKNLAYPQKYPDNLQKQAAFENACDYFYYGYGKQRWIDSGHNRGLSDDDSKRTITLWNTVSRMLKVLIAPKNRLNITATNSIYSLIVMEI